MKNARSIRNTVLLFAVASTLALTGCNENRNDRYNGDDMENGANRDMDRTDGNMNRTDGDVNNRTDRNDTRDRNDTANRGTDVQGTTPR